MKLLIVERTLVKFQFKISNSHKFKWGMHTSNVYNIVCDVMVERNFQLSLLLVKLNFLLVKYNPCYGTVNPLDFGCFFDYEPTKFFLFNRTTIAVSIFHFSTFKFFFFRSSLFFCYIFPEFNCIIYKIFFLLRKCNSTVHL